MPSPTYVELEVAIFGAALKDKRVDKYGSMAAKLLSIAAISSEEITSRFAYCEIRCMRVHADRNKKTFGATLKAMSADSIVTANVVGYKTQSMPLGGERETRCCVCDSPFPTDREYDKSGTPKG